jgi:MYXO-CTERM domain-containing protein
MFNSKTTLTLVAVFASAAFVSSAQAAVFLWTGAVSNSLNNTANWLEDGGAASVFPADSNDQPATPSASDSIVFDSTTWNRGPRTLYTRSGNQWGVIRVVNGTVTWKNDGNNQGNHSWSDATTGTPTMEVGDGDATAAVANLNVVDWNDANGDKTYVVYSDGTLASARGGNQNWSSGGNDTVMRLIGGAFVTNGALDEADLLTDANDYVTFEAIGSTFTFNKGGAGWFKDASDVTSGFGDAFRLAGGLNSSNAELLLIDNGASWTVTVQEVVVPEPASLAAGLVGLTLIAGRRRR